MTPAERLARQVVETRRYTRWRVWRGSVWLATVPASAAGYTEAEARVWVAELFCDRIPASDLRLEGVR